MSATPSAKPKAASTVRDTAPKEAATAKSPVESSSATSAPDGRPALQALLRTALPDLVLEGQGLTGLSAALTQAHEAWGLGLRHVVHEVRQEDGGALALYADGARVGGVQDSPEQLAATYATMQAQDEDGRSAWAVLPEGHRVKLEGGTRQVRVLVEDGRDFESHWAAHTGGISIRTGRQGEDLWVEVFRAVDGRNLVQDAAWEVVERIKDRALRRELQRRAEERGILGAVLSARSESIGAVLKQSPSLHFTINAAVMHTRERSLEAWRTLQKEALATLESAQAAQINRLVALLGSNTPGR
ncbi:DNA repair protein [Deinococcus ruber]|uniref:DNA repair protein PprA n=1 Tax=Deinococcus ruber TaxID=1848197 RepID=A0A918CDV6_9DEIO|nr:DNA repair protein [Deinococcus ruber]GGR18653.1 DNA repair protein PprA [Deinococcus ruber]